MVVIVRAQFISSAPVQAGFGLDAFGTAPFGS